jgi:hypothetical protein
MSWQYQLILFSPSVVVERTFQENVRHRFDMLKLDNAP